MVASMSVEEKITWLRWRERLWGLMLLLVVVVVGWGIITEILFGKWLLISLLILFLLIALTVWWGRRVDSEISLIASQVNFFSDQESLLLYERSPIPYITVDQKGVVMECNQAAVQLLKGNRNTLLQSYFFNHIAPTEDVDRNILTHKIVNGLTLTDVEVLLTSFDSQEVWVLLSVYPHRDPHWRVLSLINITERKVIDTAKSEFVALATHQLRTPIAAIRWNLELLVNKLKAPEDSSENKYLTRITRNVLLMSSLIDDFLNVSKLEMGTFATAVEDIDFAEFMERVFDEFAEKITNKELTVNKPTVSGWRIKTDRRLLHIIISNLVSNAVKYLKPKGVLSVVAEAGPSRLTIKISDDGIGIPESEVPRLFTKFFRATNAHTQETQGTGLGLYVVKQSVEKLGGTINVESKENAGATFIVTLPLRVESGF